MDEELASNHSATVDQQLVIKSSLPEALPSPDTTPVESTQPDNHALKENALSCQIRLTELLKVIANNKRASNNMVSDQHTNPGPSGDSCKPLRKAKYSWQVKNLSGQNQSTATNEGGSQGQEVQGQGKGGAGDSTEPPQKKPKLSEDIPSSISLGIHSKDTTTNNKSPTSLSTASVDESSASSEGQSTFERQKGAIEGSENVSEEDSKIPSTSNKSPGQVQRGPSSRSSSVLAKWQSKHIAQSIVDNAINATLEVLGFSLAVGARHPGQAIIAAAQAAQGRTLEEDAVSVVIQARGLQGTEQVRSAGDGEPRQAASLGSEIEDCITHGHSQTQAIQSASHMNPLDPLFGRLTHFTETMSTVDHTTVASSASKVSAENQQDVSGADTLSSLESSVDLDNLFSNSLQTDVLNKAVCAAISQKGLTVDEDL